MVDINWSLAALGPQNFQNALANGQQIGANLGGAYLEGKQRGALSQYAANPGSPEGMNALAKWAPEYAIQERARLQKQAAQAQQQKRVDMTDIAKLFEGVTPENYGQRLQLAQQWGLDTREAPPSFDPEWVQEQKIIVDVFANDPQALPGIAQELQAAGVNIETPEGKQALRDAIESKYAATYTDRTGATRQRSIFPGQQQQGPQPGMIEDGYRFKGGNPADPNAWEPVNQGGPTQPASAGFPGN